MKIEKIILDFIKSENKGVEIAGLRGLVKSGENEWSFRFTYRDEDFLSVSDLLKVQLDGIAKNPSFISKKVKKTSTKKIKQ